MLLPSKRGGLPRKIRLRAPIDRKLILLGILFLAGVLCGALSYSWLDEETRTLLGTTFTHYVRIRAEQTTQTMFLHLMLPDTLFLTVIFLCGHCAVATPVLLFLPFFKGLGFGMFSSLFLLECGNSSIKLIAFTVFPAVLWSTVLLIFACRDAFLLSFAFSEAARTGSGQVRSGRFCAIMLFYFLLLAIGCAAQVFLFQAFGVRLLTEL
jgi:hypothetical protein